MAIDKHNIKSNFRTEENLPEEFSWDNMEQGIYEKMNSKKSRRPTGIIFFSIIALVLIIIASGAIYCLNDENKNSTELNTTAPIDQKESIVSEYNNTENAHAEIKNRNESIIKTESKKIKKSFALNNENGTTEITISKEIKTKRSFVENKSTNSNIEKNTNHNKENEVKNHEFVNSSNAPIVNSKAELINKQALNEIENVIDHTPQVESIKENSIVENKNQNQSEILIADIESKIFLLIHNSSRELPLIEILNSSIKKQVENQLKNSIFITGGLLSSLSNYGNTPLDNMKSKYEHDEIGYSFGLAYNRVISNKISLTTGLDYFTLRNVLDYKETSSYSEQRENLLLSMDINTITGDTIRSFGTGTVTGKRTRTVLHYNTQKVISIPLIFSYNIQKSKFNYTIGLGPVLNYNLYAKGRTINAVDDFQAIVKEYYNSLTYGMNARIGIEYFMNKRYFIGLDFHFTTPLNNWNTTTDFSMRRNIIGSNLSVGYRF